MFKKTFGGLYKTTLKFRKIIVAILIVYAIWFFGLGIIGGWLISKGTLSALPDFTKDDRVLVLAPHIDDEVIGASGVIQQVLSAGAQLKVVYMTNGDNNIGSVVTEDKNLKTTPDKFVALGEQRMQEGKDAMKALGVPESDLVFLGYPDKGLIPMLSGNYFAPYTSVGTRFNYNPYQGTLRQKQAYTGANVVTDLQEIINKGKPTMVFVTHPRDQHPDHSATYQYLQKSLVEFEKKPQIYAFVVHYSFYPPRKGLQTNRFIHPPKKLFTKEGWYSYDLVDDQENKKLDAINQNLSQTQGVNFTGGTYGTFMRSFVKRNEIFELMD